MMRSASHERNNKTTRSDSAAGTTATVMDEFEMFRRQSLHGGRTDASETSEEKRDVRSRVQKAAVDNQRRFTVHEADRSAPRLSLAARRSVDRLSPYHARIAADSPIACAYNYSHAGAGAGILYESAPVQFDDVKICHLSSVIKNSWCAATQSAFCTKPVLKTKGKKERSSSSNKSIKTVAFDLHSDHRDSARPFAVPATYYVQVLGSNSVGKSTLCSQFVGANCDDSDDESVEDCDSEHDEFSRPRRISVVLDGEESALIFLHTMAQNDLERVSVVSGVHAYLVVYAIDDLASFHFAHAMLECILVNNDMKTAAILVANKSDLARCKEVTTDEGKLLASRFSCVFVETSATLQHRVEDLLVEILKQIRLSIARQTRFALQNANANANATDCTPLTADFLDTEAEANGDGPKHGHGIFCSILRRISKHK